MTWLQEGLVRNINSDLKAQDFQSGIVMPSTPPPGPLWCVDFRGVKQAVYGASSPMKQYREVGFAESPVVMPGHPL